MSGSQTAGDASDPVLDRMVDYLAARPHLPRLIQRAGLDDSKALRGTVGRLLGPLYSSGMQILAGTSSLDRVGDPASRRRPLPSHLRLLRQRRPAWRPSCPTTRAAPRRWPAKRSFLKVAVARLLGGEPVAARAPRLGKIP